MTDLDRARHVRDALPVGGLFAGQDWRTSPTPFALGPDLARDLASLGRVVLQFYRAANLLYRRSLEGQAPAWVAALLDQGKPAELLAWQRHAAFKQHVPRVIRPDVLMTEEGMAITELDSVPGGIGLTHWLNRTYAGLGDPVVGGSSGMADGFASIFGAAPHVHIVVSEEAASYRPEMAWLASQLGSERFHVRDAGFTDFAPGDGVYRFFELFDLPNVPAARTLFDAAAGKTLSVTPPPKPLFEEKLLLALLWNRNLAGFWRQELGAAFFERLLRIVPRSWVIDPSPLPPHAAFPGLDLTDWAQLKQLSQRERELILKISGFHPDGWGSRGVYLGSDLSAVDWSAAVDRALASWPDSPFILQRYHRPKLVEASHADFTANAILTAPARVRLCPYYFVAGDGDGARANLGGVLATLNPADKKIIHGMSEAILAPCVA
jgi:hypothetical protein